LSTCENKGINLQALHISNFKIGIVLNVRLLEYEMCVFLHYNLSLTWSSMGFETYQIIYTDVL